MTDESVIQKAEERMFHDAESHSSPWAMNLVMIMIMAGVIAPLIIFGAVNSVISPKASPTVGQEWLFVISLICVGAFFWQSRGIAKESQWLGLGYNGSVEFADNIRIGGEIVDYGELKQEEGENKPVIGYRYGRPIPVPSGKPKWHLYGFPLLRKSMPELCVALPEHPEKCCKFIGHAGYGYVWRFPWTVRHISHVSFLRTTFTQDPDDTIVPVGVFTDYDLLREDMKNGLEAKVPTGVELKIAVNVRDNYYRQKAMQLVELKEARILQLIEQLKQEKQATRDQVAAILDAWDKGGKRHKPAIPGTISRRRQLLYYGIVIGLIILGMLGLTGKL